MTWTNPASRSATKASRNSWVNASIPNRTPPTRSRLQTTPSAGVDNRPHMIAAQCADDVPWYQAVDDLDTLEMLGGGHHLEEHAVHRHGLQVHGHQLGHGDLGDE